MSVKMETEIEKTCRLCLKQSSDLESIGSCKIDSVPVLEAMQKNLDISPNSILLQESILPGQICQECIEIMTRHTQLKAIAKASEAYFESLLGQHFPTSEKIEIPEVFIKNEIVQEDETSLMVATLQSDDEAEPESSHDGDETKVIVKKEPIDAKARPKREKRHHCQICSKAFEKVSYKEGNYLVH